MVLIFIVLNFIKCKGVEGDLQVIKNAKDNLINKKNTLH